MILLRCRKYGQPDWSEVRFDLDQLGIQMAQGLSTALSQSDHLHVQLATTEGIVRGTGWEDLEDFNWPEGEDNG